MLRRGQGGTPRWMANAMSTAPISITEWMAEKQQKPAEVWREILYQLRQLSHLRP